MLTHMKFVYCGLSEIIMTTVTMAVFHHRNNRVMRDALSKIGCPLFYSLWDHNFPAQAEKFANSWSIPGGINDIWDSMIS